MKSELYIELLRHVAKTYRPEMGAFECKTVGGVADLCTVQKKGVYEYEIKASMNDYHNERKYKSKKHKWYAQFDHNKQSIPQYFVLVVPKGIIHEMSRFDEINPNYGILTFHETLEGYKFEYYREPHALNNGKAGKIRKEIQRRMFCDYADLLDMIANVKQS